MLSHNCNSSKHMDTCTRLDVYNNLYGCLEGIFIWLQINEAFDGQQNTLYELHCHKQHMLDYK